MATRSKTNRRRGTPSKPLSSQNPQVSLRIVVPGAQLLAESLAQPLILVQRPGARHFELVVMLVEVAHRDAVTELGFTVAP